MSALAVGFAILTVVSYAKDCRSPVNLIGIEPPPLSETQRVNILLRGSELLSLVDQGASMGEVWITEVLSDHEQMWMKQIAVWLRYYPHLKAEVLGEVFVPLGSSARDAFLTRVTGRLNRINTMEHASA